MSKEKISNKSNIILSWVNFALALFLLILFFIFIIILFGIEGTLRSKIIATGLLLMIFLPLFIVQLINGFTLRGKKDKQSWN